jgi:hypothetical protein
LAVNTSALGKEFLHEEPLIGTHKFSLALLSSFHYPKEIGISRVVFEGVGLGEILAQN